MDKQAYIVFHQQGERWLFGTLGRVMQSCFEQLGYAAQCFNVLPNPDIVRDCDIVFVIAIQMIEKPNKKRGTYIGYQQERMPRNVGMFSNKYVENWRMFENYYRSYDYIFETCPANAEFEKMQGYKSILVPIGYHPIFELQIDRERCQHIPMCLIGSTRGSNRRQDIMKRLRKRFPHSKAAKDAGNNKKRAEYLSTSKIQLNIHSDETRMLESLRVIGLYLSNQCFVISEPCDYEPLQHGVHWIISEYENIQSTCDYYLQHKKERLGIARQGYEFIKNNYRMIDHLQTGLKKVDTMPQEIL